MTAQKSSFNIHRKSGWETSNGTAILGRFSYGAGVVIRICAEIRHQVPFLRPDRVAKADLNRMKQGVLTNISFLNYDVSKMEQEIGRKDVLSLPCSRYLVDVQCYISFGLKKSHKSLKEKQWTVQKWQELLSPSISLISFLISKCLVCNLPTRTVKSSAVKA